MSRTKKASYTGSKRFDRSCRNHGTCGYCVGNRLYSTNKKVLGLKEQEKSI